MARKLTLEYSHFNTFDPYQVFTRLRRPIQSSFTVLIMASTSPLAFRYYNQAQTKYEIPLLAGDNAYLGDVFSSEKLSPETPISAGLYRLKKGEPLVYTYKYDEMKIILEGELDHCILR